MMQVAPDVGRDKDALLRIVEMHHSLMPAIRDTDITLALYGENDLRAGAVGMTAPAFALWHIRDPEHTFDVERDDVVALGEEKLSSVVGPSIGFHHRAA